MSCDLSNLFLHTPFNAIMNKLSNDLDQIKALPVVTHHQPAKKKLEDGESLYQVMISGTPVDIYVKRFFKPGHICKGLVTYRVKIIPWSNEVSHTGHGKTAQAAFQKVLQKLSLAGN